MIARHPYDHKKRIDRTKMMNLIIISSIVQRSQVAHNGDSALHRRCYVSTFLFNKTTVNKIKSAIE